MKHSLKAVLILAALTGGVAQAATEYTWQPTTGGDMMTGSNWSPAGLPEGAASARLTIGKAQSAPITLTNDFSCLGGKHYFSFTGELKFDSAATTLTLGGGNLYLNGNGCTTRLTRGTLVNKNGCYYENGNDATRFILSGSDVTADFQSGVTVGSWQRNKSFEVENGATFKTTGVTVGRDDNGGSNDTFKVTGTGTTATLSGTLQVNNGGNNEAEISDGAKLSAKDVVIGYWYKRDNTLALTNVFNSGNKVLVDGGEVTVKGGAVTVGYHTCSNSLEIVNGGKFTVISNVFNLTPLQNVGQTATGSVPYNFPSLNYRLNGNKVLVSGAGSLLKLDGGGNQGFWLGRGIGDDCRVDIENGGRWESSGEFKMGDGPCTNGLFRVGPGGYFTHKVYSVAVGIGGSSSAMRLEFDGGTGVVTTVSTTVGNSGKNPRIDVKNQGAYFGKSLTLASSAAASNCVFSVTSGGFSEFSGDVMIGNSGQVGTLVADGGTFIATNGTTKAAASAGSTGSRLVVRNGGVVKLKTVYWGDQGNAVNDCGIVVSNGTLMTSSGLNLGGSDDTVAHGCWMTVGGTSSSLVFDFLSVNRDSTLSFAVPKNGFEATPVKAKTLSFGTKCATRPTLKVTADPHNQAKYVTLVEAENNITVPADLNLDLPTGAKLLQAGDDRYDAKKLTVKLPVYGMVLVFR